MVKRRRKRISVVRPSVKIAASPGTLTAHSGGADSLVSVIAYGPEKLLEDETSDLSKLEALVSSYPVVWINIVGLGSLDILTEVGEQLGLHRLALEDVLNIPQRPKLDDYGDHQFIVARMPVTHEHLETEQLSIFLGKSFVLTVQERPGELFLHHFWLITNWSAEEMPADELLELYRERGSAEGYMGELMNVLSPALSSSPRPKRHYRGCEPQRRSDSCDAFAHNEVRLLLNMLAYNVCHAVRVLLEKATGQGWSLQRLRERVLKTAGRLVLHSRYVMVVIGVAGAGWWTSLLVQMGRWRPPDW